MRFIEIFQKISSRLPKGYLAYYYFIRLLPLNRRKIANELDGNLFFITSTGRTGTTLFSKMLDESSDANVVHEPVYSEQYFHGRTLENPDFSLVYVNNFRLKEIYLRKRTKKYGEVNSAIRRNIKDIKNLLPNTPMIHIVRDGYDVVSSILNRKTFTEADSFYGTMVPHSSIISPGDWLSFSRFEKICFMWAEENRWLSEVCDVSVKFESLISDYNYFSEMVSDVVGIKVTEDRWAQSLSKKINPNGSYDERNSPKNWTDKQLEQFERICGKEMVRYGYKIESGR